MARILRGEILWADLNPVRGREQAGHRPIVVISQDVFNARSGTVIAMALGKKIGRVVPEELDRLIEGLNEIVGG